MFPTWPAKSELGHKTKKNASPKAPEGGGQSNALMVNMKMFFLWENQSVAFFISCKIIEINFNFFFQRSSLKYNFIISNIVNTSKIMTVRKNQVVFFFRVRKMVVSTWEEQIREVQLKVKVLILNFNYFFRWREFDEWNFIL